MLKTNKDEKDVKFVLDNIRFEDEVELKALWNKNWKEKVLQKILDSDFLTLMGKNGNKKDIPIAVGGFYEIPNYDRNMVCVWLISSKFINLNKKLFWKELKYQINEASKVYKIMYNYIYESNFEAKKWLKKLGFKFDNPKPKKLNIPKRFEFFYKVNMTEKISREGTCTKFQDSQW